MGNGVSFAPETLFEALDPTAMVYFPKVPKLQSIRKINKNRFAVYLDVDDYDPDDVRVKTATLFEAIDTSAMEYFPKVPKPYGCRKPSKDRFEIYLDVEDYGPDDIRVKTIDGYVVVEGQHKEKREEDGWVQRQFKRRCPIPEGYKTEALLTQYSSDGTLIITANLVKIDEPKSDMPVIKKTVVPVIQEGEGKDSDEDLDEPEPDAGGNRSEKKPVKPNPKGKTVEVKDEIEDEMRMMKMKDEMEIFLEKFKEQNE